MAINLTGILEASSIRDLALALDAVSGYALFNAVYLALLFLFVIGYAIPSRIQIGMAVGGFMTCLIGLAMVSLGFISVYSFMVSVVLFLVGIFIMYITRQTL